MYRYFPALTILLAWLLFFSVWFQCPRSPVPSSNTSHSHRLDERDDAPIKSMVDLESASLRRFRWPNKDSGGIFSYIWRHQHPNDCSSAKFMVWRSKDYRRDTRGLAAFATTAAAHLAVAIEYDRVFIIDGKPWPMAMDTERCGDDHTRDCYFEPLSSCSIADVRESDAAFYIEDNNKPIPEDVRVVYTTEMWFRLSTRTHWQIQPAPNEKRMGSPALRMEFNMAAIAYYFTPRPWLRELIERNLAHSVPDWLVANRAVAMPVRASDKCKDHGLHGSAGGEMTCSDFSDFMEAAEGFRAFDPLVDTIILTSEDESVVQASRDSRYKHWRFVYNQGDVMQGTGSGNAITNYRNVTKDAVVASALSSLHLAMRARYYVLDARSSWNVAIGLLSRDESIGFATGRKMYFDMAPPSVNALRQEVTLIRSKYEWKSVGGINL